jgi:hypothetical protein
MQKFIFLILFWPLAHYGLAQNKFEKEIRIKEKDVPQAAISFVDELAFTKKVKWFREIGLDKISFEAKTKKEGKWYSIEFSEDGSFEDLEIEIEPNEIPDATYERIITYFDNNHEKFAIEKIQIQYSGNHTLNYILGNGPVVDFIIRYEIVLSSKVEGAFVLLEELFDDEGNFINSSRIILERFDNIVY